MRFLVSEVPLQGGAEGEQRLWCGVCRERERESKVVDVWGNVVDVAGAEGK